MCLDILFGQVYESNTERMHKYLCMEFKAKIGYQWFERGCPQKSLQIMNLASTHSMIY